MRKLDTIFVHCSATPKSWMKNSTAEAKVAEIRRWHTEERGWSDIGYTYVIDTSGEVVEGRPIERAGAHARGHNAHSVGICLIGGHGGEQDDLFEEHFTHAQARALRRLIATLRLEFPSITKVRGHNEVSASKACPCFQVSKWMNGAEAIKKPERKKVSQTKTIQSSTVAKAATLAPPVIASVGGLEWQKLLIMGVFGLIALVALGVIDIERIRKFNSQGDR